MSEFFGGRYARHDVEYLNAWFVYAALGDTGRPVFVAKIGISTTPLKRMAQVHMNSPYPIVAGMWAMVGGQAQARRAESRIKKAFADRSTRGEWFEFDQTKDEDKRRFNFTVKSLCAAAANRELEWHRVQKREIEAFIAADMQVSLENSKKRG